MSLVFHIIYVPGSVSTQLAFVETLLEWSDCSFRLVANGCTPAEVRLMRTYCQLSPRLQFFQIPTAEPLAHQHALNYLQAAAQEDFFCFMDSDILAAGPFLEAVIPLLETHTAIFAGAPLWCRPQDQEFLPGMDVVCGEHNRTQAGLPLGGTFFAVYNQAVLTDYIRSSGMGFEMRGWPYLPDHLRIFCSENHLAGPNHFFDTGKVLNLGLLQRGDKLVVMDSPNLLHLGGLSFIAKHRRNTARSRQAGLAAALVLELRLILGRMRRRWRNEPMTRSFNMPFARRRKLYGQYFADLLAASQTGAVLPALPEEDDPEVAGRAAHATRLILSLAPGVQALGEKPGGG